MEHGVGIGLGGAGFSAEGHSGFPRGVSGFLMVAGDAGAGDVFPCMGAASVAGHYVVDGEIFGLLAAVLTSVAVSQEHLLS